MEDNERELMQERVECDEGMTMKKRLYEEETVQDRLMENDDGVIIQERIEFNRETTDFQSGLE